MQNSIIPIRFNQLDKAALHELSSRLNMNRSEVVRSLVREYLVVLKERESQTRDPKQLQAKRPAG